MCGAKCQRSISRMGLEVLYIVWRKPYFAQKGVLWVVKFEIFLKRGTLSAESYSKKVFRYYRWRAIHTKIGVHHLQNVSALRVKTLVPPLFSQRGLQLQYDNMWRILSFILMQNKMITVHYTGNEL